MSIKEMGGIIKVDHQFMEALSELAARLNKTEADVIRDALNYYSNAVDEWDRTNLPNQSI
jgi:predicted transcriptional regulator